jgi:hypothetical protein
MQKETPNYIKWAVRLYAGRKRFSFLKKAVEIVLLFLLFIFDHIGESADTLRYVLLLGLGVPYIHLSITESWLNNNDGWYLMDKPTKD